MSRRTSLFAGAILLIVIVAGCYAPVYQADFVDFDDYDYVHGNDHVTSGLTLENVQWAFTTPHSSNWHPLTWISHMVDVELFGLNPHGHHAMNTALHAINAVLLFLMLASITGQIAPSFVVAALFAVHPVNVECVAWVAQRKSTLSTLFAILTIWSYCLYVRDKSRKQYAASLGFFILSLMAKQTMVTMPFALLLLDYWPLERKELQPARGQRPTILSLLKGWWRLFPEKLPYLAVVVLASVTTLFVQQQAMQAVERYPLAARLGNVAISYVGYLVSLVWPVHLAVFYPLEVTSITLPRVAGALAILAIASYVLCRLGLRWRYLLVGWLWFLGTMVPMIGLVHVGAQSMADRYAYIPFWGLWIALAWSARDVLAWLGQRAPPRTAVAFAVAAGLAGLTWLTYAQAGKWHDTTSLFEDALADTPSNWLAHRQLASQYIDQGDYPRALHHCEEAIKQKRGSGRILAIYGLALYATGSHESGIERLQEAIKISPQDSLAFTNLGWIYSEQGQYVQAAELFAVAARYITSTDTPYARRMVYANWGNVLAKLNRWPEAAEKYDSALAITPDPNFLRDAAEVDLHLNRPDRAIKRLKQAVDINPQDAAAASLMARSYLIQGNLPAAAGELERAIKLNPRDANSILELARVLPRLGRADEAKQMLNTLLTAAQSQRGDQIKILCSTIRVELGNIAMMQKDVTAAIEQYDRALADWPDNHPANNNLAWLLATQPDEKRRDPQRAVKLALHACKLLKTTDHATLGTLAAAYAANNSLPQAVRTAREAMELATKAGDKSAADAFRQQLQLYEQGKPYVER